jgi:homoserine acetyltransferase
MLILLIAIRQVTIRDSVRLHLQLVREGIGATGIKCVIGGSMGEMSRITVACHSIVIVF